MLTRIIDVSDLEDLNGNRRFTVRSAAGNAVSESGSDGVVRVAGANLNSRIIKLLQKNVFRVSRLQGDSTAGKFNKTPPGNDIAT